MGTLGKRSSQLRRRPRIPVSESAEVQTLEVEGNRVRGSNAYEGDRDVDESADWDSAGRFERLAKGRPIMVALFVWNRQRNTICVEI